MAIKEMSVINRVELISLPWLLLKKIAFYRLTRLQNLSPIDGRLACSARFLITEQETHFYREEPTDFNYLLDRNFQPVVERVFLVGRHEYADVLLIEVK